MEQTHMQRTEDAIQLGFWLYLMTDFVLFASLFATFAVLRFATFQGPDFEIFDLRYVFVETIVLLVSSFAAGIALLGAKRQSLRLTICSLFATLFLGALFASMEVLEFASLVQEGAGPSRSGFLSSYFALVGTHGLHITAGLVWLAALIVALSRRGFTPNNTRKLVLWSLFWHFLDLIWIFIFTIVYLLPFV